MSDEHMAFIQARARNRNVAIAVLGLLILVGGLAAIVFVFLPMRERPTTGKVRVVTHPPGAHVECNGEPQPGLTPDVVIKNLSVHENHSLYISKPGYTPVHRSFSVKAGEKRTIEVKLERR